MSVVQHVLVVHAVADGPLPVADCMSGVEPPTAVEAAPAAVEAEVAAGKGSAAAAVETSAVDRKA